MISKPYDPTHVHLDAARYRRLRVLGAAGVGPLDRALLLGSDVLDAFVDADICACPSRGEALDANALSAGDTANLRHVRSIIQRLHHREPDEWGESLEGALGALAKVLRAQGVVL